MVNFVSGNGRLVTSGLPVIKEFLRSIHTSRLIGTDPFDEGAGDLELVDVLESVADPIGVCRRENRERTFPAIEHDRSPVPCDAMAQYMLDQCLGLSISSLF
jgi:hypothetical protein